MKLINSKIFGNLRSPDNFDDLLKIITNCSPDSAYTARMWRGQGDIDWRVDSSAYRRLQPVNEDSLGRYEKRLLEQATHKGYRSVDGRLLSDMELLARLQHHGAATRLVDASRNAFIALWFCCVSEPNKTGVLIGVPTHHLSGNEGEGENRPYDEIIRELQDYNNVFTWDPPVVTKRIAAQNSQFLYSRIVDEKWGSLMLNQDDEITNITAISPELKIKCLAALEALFDIRYLTLFPDLDGFCQSNSADKSRYYNDRW